VEGSVPLRLVDRLRLARQRRTPQTLCLRGSLVVMPHSAVALGQLSLVGHPRRRHRRLCQLLLLQSLFSLQLNPSRALRLPYPLLRPHHSRKLAHHWRAPRHQPLLLPLLLLRGQKNLNHLPLPLYSAYLSATAAASPKPTTQPASTTPAGPPPGPQCILGPQNEHWLWIVKLQR
jgi:hypothetical protein